MTNPLKTEENQYLVQDDLSQVDAQIAHLTNLRANHSAAFGPTDPVTIQTAGRLDKARARRAALA